MPASPWGPPKCNAVANAQRGFRGPKPLRGPGGDGIVQNIEYSGLWGAITTFPKRRPFATNVIIATVKTSFADLLVQADEGKKPSEFDLRRNGVFVAFGCVYLGFFQWFIYVTVFSKVCPNAIRFANLTWSEKLKDKAGQIDLVKQVCLDNFVHYTFIYFPVFYVFKQSIQVGDDASYGIETVKDGLGRYWKNCVQDNLAMWSLWVPGDFLVYAVPIWLRLPLNHGISLAWTIILSWMRGGEK